MSNVFSNILNRSLDEVTAPTPLPVGTYDFAMTLKVKAPKTEDDDGFIQGIFAPQRAHDDVSPEELEQYGELEGARVFKRFWMRDKRDEWTMKQLLSLAGVETNGRTLLDAIQAADGYRITAKVEHDPNKDDPERPYERLSQFAAVS